MFVKSADVEITDLGQGVKRAVLARGGGLMAVEVSFEKGSSGAQHSHEHEQISYIISGSIEYTINGVKQLLSAGESCYVPSGAVHGVLALEQSKLVDIFSPQREDFL